MTVLAVFLMTESEAADALRLCPRTLRKARQEGRLGYVLIGRAIRYSISDLESFVLAARQDNLVARPTSKGTARRGGGIFVPFTKRG